MQSRNVIIKRKCTFCVINFIIQTEISLAEPNDERTNWKRESVKETERGIEIGIKLTVHKFAMQTNRVIHIKKWEITQFMHLNAGKLV